MRRAGKQFIRLLVEKDFNSAYQMLAEPFKKRVLPERFPEFLAESGIANIQRSIADEFNISLAGHGEFIAHLQRSDDSYVEATVTLGKVAGEWKVFLIQIKVPLLR